jgi:predicted dehydrogenase/aryl-alcohol dehydrogenase-like predicted oxidoreductase
MLAGMDKAAGVLEWGILGPGRIARAFASALATSTTGRLVAVGGRRQEAADAFAREFKADRAHGSYEAMLADPGVQAVYVAVPHPWHAEWAIKAAEAGKHILCEKPLGLNHAEAMAIVESAKDNDVFLMEAFMYRCHPYVARLVELLRSGAIGEVRHIQAVFSFQTGFDPKGRLFANELGGGGILDVGCYCTSMARLVAGAATGKDFAEPIELKACGHLGATGVDEWTTAVAKFPGEITASLSTGVSLGLDSSVRIYGSAGNIHIPSPWIPPREGGKTVIIVQRAGASAPEEVVVDSPRWLYAVEADTVAANIALRQAPAPAMSWNDSLGNMRTLDLWRESIGLVYESEKPTAYLHTVTRRPLTRKPKAPMTYGAIPGMDKPVSRLVMGVDNQFRMPHAAVMFDDYFEHGGTTFDTAHIYGGGACERVLGQWVRNRGVRDQVVVIGKGAHTPFCTPEFLTAQLAESLERLQMDRVDLYLMHRDNLAVPVGEFIDVLNRHQREGRLGAFGVSNWTLPRVDEANAWATAHRQKGFVAVSNNLSLARMTQPVWNGSLTVSDPASRAWFARTRVPLLAWSSQARGFFTDRADPSREPEPDLQRSWYSAANYARRARAYELAAKRGVEPVHVALAYVLCQPFPTFALIGPRTIAEFRSSLAGLALTLSPEEIAWLDGTEA